MKKILFSTIFLFLISCTNNDSNNIDNNDGENSEIISDNNSESSSCHKPSELRVEQITSNSAVFKWAGANGAQLFNIEYSSRGFSLGNGERISVSSTEKEITGLSSATEYDFYVRANCGGNSYSEWTGPHSFVTK